MWALGCTSGSQPNMAHARPNTAHAQWLPFHEAKQCVTEGWCVQKCSGNNSVKLACGGGNLKINNLLKKKKTTTLGSMVFSLKKKKNLSNIFLWQLCPHTWEPTRLANLIWCPRYELFTYSVSIFLPERLRKMTRGLTGEGGWITCL